MGIWMMLSGPWR